MYVTICKIESQWEFAIRCRKPKPLLHDNLEGWMGWRMGGRFERKETGVYLCLIHADIRQKPP